VEGYVVKGLVWVLPVLCALAQHHHAPPGEKPPILLPNLGTHRHVIATNSPEAQRFFDQGLRMLYGFNRYEAFRSFRRASELDPHALMPHWGMAMATGPHINMDLDGDVDMKASCAAVDKGRALRDQAPAHERAWFDAVAVRCPEYKPEEYIQAARELSRRYPDDLDAATVFAESLMLPSRWRWWSASGVPAEGTEEAVRTLEAVMRRHPEHPGANHFYIHAVEASPSPERAIPSAQRLMGVVPAAGHLVHMPAHIWMILGDYEMAATVNERAAEVDRQYMDTTGVTGSAYVGYYVHNLHFVAYARQMQGRYADAMKAAATLSAAAEPHIQAMAMMVDAFAPAPLFALLRFARWDDILASKPPDPRLLSYTAVWRFARATAFSAKGRRDDALKEKMAFEEARGKVPADWLWLNNKAVDVLAVAAESIEARTAGGQATAIPHWRRAIDLQDALVYDEPPPWFYPVRESLGAALLGAGQAAEAEAVFREGLRRGPRNGRLLFGLLESLKALRKDYAVQSVQAEFERAWSKADVKLRIEDF
jgi:tetratricopeptide (TPR) repeat protein